MPAERIPSDPREWIAERVKGFLATSPLNTLGEPGGEKAWEEPLVGFSSGADPLYLQLKEMIGEFYWTPEEAFRRAFPEHEARAAELTVIAWVLPQTALTKGENATQKVYASRRWVGARGPGEDCNAVLRREVVAALAAAGVPAMAPQLHPDFGRHASHRYGPASSWSERHAAFVSGLGTFGLCDGIITAKGKAVRVGSVVARLACPATPRPYGDDHRAYCLYFSHGTCLKCVPRCPVQAISERGHDKDRCLRHVEVASLPHNQKTYGIKVPACGLCQVGVPCESGIPDPAAG